MNHWVSVQRQAAGQSASGQPNGAWVELAKEWAAIKPISGREYFNASGERAEITHTVELRAGGNYVPRDRIVYGSRVFNIKSVINVEERNRKLRLMVSEHVD
jgi:SPP1 family predicted phage head-tail adaptor